MFRSKLSRRLSLPLVACALLTGACGPSELTTPSAVQAERIIGETFPQAAVQVREVNRTEQTLRVPAQFGEADVIFLMAAGEEDWQITGVEQGDNTYTVDELRQIAASMETMRELSDGLEQYRAAEGAYPLLDDLVGLREIVPDYYPMDGSMQDAWGNPFRYRAQGDDDYTVTSTGPDGQAGSRDDIILITGSFVAQ